MSELRLVGEELDGAKGPFSAGTPLPARLPRGRHGIPPGLVAEHQRLRLLAALAAALAEHGYADLNTTQVSERASVSTATFYKHFGNLWDCALAAYVWSADRLCEAIEADCGASEERDDAAGRPGGALESGLAAALDFLAAEPTLARLLSAQAPREASALGAARRLLVSRLAAMLRRSRGADVELGPQPPSLDERMIDASLTFVGARLAAEGPRGLAGLAPELTAILGRSRQPA